jgi:hypothetical protein
MTTTTRLRKGPLKVITFCGPEPIRENELRRRANGKVYHPTVRVAVQPTTEGEKAHTVEGFAVNLKKATAHYSIGATPHAWAVQGNADVHHWIETTGEVEIQTTFEP